MLELSKIDAAVCIMWAVLNIPIAFWVGVIYASRKLAPASVKGGVNE